MYDHISAKLIKTFFLFRSTANATIVCFVHVI